MQTMDSDSVTSRKNGEDASNSGGGGAKLVFAKHHSDSHVGKPLLFQPSEFAQAKNPGKYLLQPSSAVQNADERELLMRRRRSSGVVSSCNLFNHSAIDIEDETTRLAMLLSPPQHQRYQTARFMTNEEGEDMHFHDYNDDEEDEEDEEDGDEHVHHRDSGFDLIALQNKSSHDDEGVIRSRYPSRGDLFVSSLPRTPSVSPTPSRRSKLTSSITTHKKRTHLPPSNFNKKKENQSSNYHVTFQALQNRVSNEEIRSNVVGDNAAPPNKMNHASNKVRETITTQNTNTNINTVARKEDIMVLLRRMKRKDKAAVSKGISGDDFQRLETKIKAIRRTRKVITPEDILISNSIKEKRHSDHHVATAAVAAIPEQQMTQLKQQQEQQQQKQSQQSSGLDDLFGSGPIQQKREEDTFQADFGVPTQQPLDDFFGLGSPSPTTPTSATNGDDVDLLSGMLGNVSFSQQQLPQQQPSSLSLGPTLVDSTQSMVSPTTNTDTSLLDLDLLSPTSSSNNTPSVATNQQNSLVADTSFLANLSSPSTPSQQQQQQQPANTPAPALSSVDISLSSIIPSSASPVHAYDANGLKINIHLAQNSPHPSLSVFVVSFLNQNSSPLTNLNFQAAVPKTLQVKLQPPSSTSIGAFNVVSGPQTVTQVMIISNPTKAALRLRFKLHFEKDGQAIDDMKDVSQFPSI
eukprot:m.62955 g.62955  ORF g.62955 m.62955 type:complete len:690 (+) comp8047_c4_seq4:46-2115(+)